MLLNLLDQLDMSSRTCHSKISVDFSSKVFYSVKKCSISRRRCRGKCVMPSTSLKRRFNVQPVSFRRVPSHIFTTPMGRTCTTHPKNAGS